MKKVFVKITALALMLVVCFSVAGCRLFEYKNGSIENLPNSTANLGNVIYGTIEGERTLEDKTVVIEKTRKSVVAIAMQDANDNVSFGSGVIADIDIANKPLGENEFYILTCHHVIAGMGDINVFLPDAEGDNYGESDYNLSYGFAGKIGPNNYNNVAVTLVGGDSVSDVAVLKLDISGSKVSKDNVHPAKFPVASYNYKVGEDVIAIGNPTGHLAGTVSFGTISYINRETSIQNIGDMTLLQLNVDIYHGSSGGALFNMYGELIGITNAGNDSYPGINFAIPYVVDIANGTNDLGFINIAGQLIASATNNNYGFITGRVSSFGFVASQQSSSTPTSVVVSSVTDGSISYKAGLVSGDVILKVAKGVSDDELYESEDITTNAQVSEVFASLEIGDEVKILVERGTVFNR